MSETRQAAFVQTVAVETPEHVVLSFELAGIGSRALAALADAGLLGAWLVVLGFMSRPLAAVGVPPGWVAAMLLAIGFASVWGYFTFFEALRQGQTPGKRWVGIRVVRDTGHPVTLAAATVRNLLRVVDLLPPPYLLGGILVLLHPRAKRLGDLVAGTLVVRDRPAVPHATRSAGLATGGSPAPGSMVSITREELALVVRFLEREAGLDPATRDRLAADLVVRLDAGPAAEAGTPIERLRGLAAQARSGAAGAPAGERLVARQGQRWEAFRALAERAARDGLDALEPAELLDFAARYREIAADLARARTYQA